MKRALMAAVIATTLYACTEAGEGSEAEPAQVKDTLAPVNSSADTSGRDTASYENMPNKTSDSSGSH